MWGTCLCSEASPQVDTELAARPRLALSVLGGLVHPWQQGLGSGRQQQLDKLLELLPVLVDVDLCLPEGVDQHRVTDLVQHDV